MKKKMLTIVALSLLIVTAIALVACTPGAEAVRTKYENAGYTYVPTSAHTLGLETESVEYVVAATKAATDDAAQQSIQVVLFVEEEDAIAYSDALAVEYAEAIGAGEIVVALDGKFVLMGTPEAVELF